MNGNVFKCYNQQTDLRQYMKEIEALEGYVKKNLKYAKDLLAPLFAPKMKMQTLEKRQDQVKRLRKPTSQFGIKMSAIKPRGSVSLAGTWPQSTP